MASSAFGQGIVFGQHWRVDDYKKNLSPFVGTPQHAVDKMLEMVAPKPGETLYDLGCGDGRILIAAAQKYKVKAVGIEIVQRLVDEANANVKRSGLQEQIKVIRGDVMQADLSHADIVTIYLMTAGNDSLRPNLEHYLKPNTRVVSYDYPIPGWKEIDKADTEGRNGASHTIYLYQVPASFKK